MENLKTFKSRFSLKDKFIFFSLFIYVLSVGAISWIIGYNAKSAIMDRTFEQLISIRSIKKRQIETFFNDRINAAKNITHYINDFDNIGAIQSELALVLQNDAYFESALIYDKNKDEFASYDKKNASLESFGAEIKSQLKSQSADCGPKILDVSINPTRREPELYIVSSLKSKKGADILIALEIPISLVNYIMLENNPSEGLGNSGESYLIGDDYLMRSASRFIENSILKTRVQTFGAINANNGEIGALETTDYRNVRVLSAYSKLSIPNLNWSLLAEIDYQEANVPINAIFMKIVMLACLISIFIFIMIYIASNRIVRPIIELINATKDIRHGRFDKKLDIHSKDEIGELSRAFNTMTLTLRKKNFALKKERLKRFSLAIDAQEKEQTRLAREIHDGLGQNFVALKYKLENLDDANIYDAGALADIKDEIDKIIDEIRQISNNLTPNVLNELGLNLALSNLCEQIEEYSGININFESNVNDATLDEKKKFYLYRIAQEALNNIVKHSKAKNVDISLLESSAYYLTIFDDGVGFVVEKAMKGVGNGLYNIRERTLSLNGTFNIESSEKGSLIRVVAPR